MGFGQDVGSTHSNLGGGGGLEQCGGTNQRRMPFVSPWPLGIACVWGFRVTTFLFFATKLRSNIPVGLPMLSDCCELIPGFQILRSQLGFSGGGSPSLLNISFFVELWAGSPWDCFACRKGSLERVAKAGFGAPLSRPLGLWAWATCKLF